MSAARAAQKAETDLTAQRAQVQARIDKVADAVPAEVIDAKRITDAAIEAKQRELGCLIEQRNRIDEAFQVSQRETAEKAALERDRAIKAKALDVLALNEKRVEAIAAMQSHLEAFAAAVCEARGLTVKMHAGINALDLPSSFDVKSFNATLSMWIAEAFDRTWPLGSEKLGSYVHWHTPPGQLRAGQPDRAEDWATRDMLGQHEADIETIARLIEERAHIR